MTGETEAVEMGGEVLGRPNMVAILDAGSQFGGLIDRNVRESGIRSVMLPLDTPVDELTDFDAIIISGGPKSVNDEDAPDCDPKIFESGKPILGVCYGMQLMAKHLGGDVVKSDIREDGPMPTEFSGGSKLFAGLENRPQKVLMSHGDKVQKLPRGFKIIGGLGGMISAIENPGQRLYATQFHPEVFQTECGPDIFQNFLKGIAGLEADYTTEDQEQEAIQNIQEVVGDKEVILFLSGGVDSTVLAGLMAKAIEDPERIHAFHIDNGFMRSGESAMVIKALTDAGVRVELLDWVDRFYDATTIIDGVETLPLNKVTDPQVKRKIIGDTFIKVRDDIIKQLELGEDVVLAQGSLRPDLIESGSLLASVNADTIKTHHNDTPLVRELRAKGLVVEPLQALYKDQVRQLGRRLGFSESIVERHPFPGPGLAIRTLCYDGTQRSAEDINLQQEAQSELDRFLKAEFGSKYYGKVLPIKSVGVQGDGRSYKPPVVIEGPMDWAHLLDLSGRIPNKVHGVNRVCYSFGPIAAEITLTKTFLRPEVLKQLRHADGIVTDLLHKNKLMGSISQMPVVLLPVSFGLEGHRSIVLRPFKSPDFMTGIAGIPGQDLPEEVVRTMAYSIMSEVPGISNVLYDLSSKPPGTTEWE